MTKSVVMESKMDGGRGHGPASLGGVEDMEMWVKKVASTNKKVEVTLEVETEEIDDLQLKQIKSLLSLQQDPVSVSILSPA